VKCSAVQCRVELLWTAAVAVYRCMCVYIWMYIYVYVLYEFISYCEVWINGTDALFVYIHIYIYTCMFSLR
jgi:hypothetical protein